MAMGEEKDQVEAECHCVNIFNTIGLPKCDAELSAAWAPALAPRQLMLLGLWISIKLIVQAFKTSGKETVT
jgi:hypothetical protein